MFSSIPHKKLAVAACLGLWAASTQASVIGASPGADFSGGAYALDLAAGAANYTFSDTGQSFLPSAVQTGGAATVATQSGAIATFGTGTLAPLIGPELAASFQGYDSPTPFYYPGAATYLGLRLDLGDGPHYGYALLGDNTLLSYGYQDTPNLAIRAGAAATLQPSPQSVAEPSSYTAFAWGLVALSMGACAYRRRRANADRENSHVA